LFAGEQLLETWIVPDRIPDVLIAWNEADRRSDSEIVEEFYSFFVATEDVLNVSRLILFFKSLLIVL